MNNWIHSRVEALATFKAQFASGDNYLMQRLAQGQSPDVMVVSCCDSRVDPTLLFGAQPGDLFVARTVANIIPPYVPGSTQAICAALEYAVCYLKVKQLLILGHTGCGGLNAMQHPEQLTQNDFISSWVGCLGCHDADNLSEQVCLESALKQSHMNALTYPWIQQAVDAGSLSIVRAYFDIEMSNLFIYEVDTGAYTELC